jgi:hypothetical protein
MLVFARLLICMLLALSGFSMAAEEPSIQMIRSQSGPSGTVIRSRFVLDAIRNRFVYPEDKSLMVYFECKAPKGKYAQNVYWKDPQGRTVVISPEIKMEIQGGELNSYWAFLLDNVKLSGIWSAELRINGQSVGSHLFELVVPEPPAAPVVTPPPDPPSMNELYQKLSKSLAWINKLDRVGRRVGRLTGFVVGQDSVLTAFQAINSAMSLEVEFENGTKTTTDEIIAYSQSQDWILLKVNTQDIPAIEIGSPRSIVIGEQLIVFSVAGGYSRTIGAVDISGRGKAPGFEERIQFNPSQLPLSAVGGPLLDFYGKAVGVLGGCVLREGQAYRADLPDRLGVQVRLDNYSISATSIDKDALQSKTPATSIQKLYKSGVRFEDEPSR